MFCSPLRPYGARLGETKGVCVDLMLLIIPIALVVIAILAIQMIGLLKRIASSNEMAIRCLDAHEALLRKAKEEQERQGADIETIKDIFVDKQ